MYRILGSSKVRLSIYAENQNVEVHYQSHIFGQSVCERLGVLRWWDGNVPIQILLYTYTVGVSNNL